MKLHQTLEFLIEVDMIMMLNSMGKFNYIKVLGTTISHQTLQA